MVESVASLGPSFHLHPSGARGQAGYGSETAVLSHVYLESYRL